MIEFDLQIKPFSVNCYHYATRKVKTADARAWECTVLEALADVKELSVLADDWRRLGGYFNISIHCFYPPFIFYTQSGEISAKTIDVTNFEKPLQDLIFKQMGLNDKLVKKMVSEKSAGTHHYIRIKLELKSQT